MINNFGVWFPLNFYCYRILIIDGNAKAKVLPEPVLSLATTSSPLQIRLKVSYWMGNNFEIPFLFNILIIC